VSITCGRKRYLLPAEDVTVLSLANTRLEALAGYLLRQVLPPLQNAGLVAAELEISELPLGSAGRRSWSTPHHDRAHPDCRRDAASARRTRRRPRSSSA
jgi:hypothetical protein